jgi:hypothetical protein
VRKARAVETHAEILKTTCVVDEASEPDSDELDALISVFQAEEDAADAGELAKGKDELVTKGASVSDAEKDRLQEENTRVYAQELAALKAAQAHELAEQEKNIAEMKRKFKELQTRKLEH